MNKKKVLISALSSLSITSVVAPLVMVATGCSCSNDDDRFAGENVLGGIYTPKVDSLGGTDAITLTQGSDEYWKYLVNHTNTPYEEFKWTSSSWAYLLEKLAEENNSNDDVTPIKFNKWTAKLSNFKINDKDSRRVSYKVTQDIDVDLDMADFGSSFLNEMGLESLVGHIKLAWCNEVKNVPINCFDFDPSGMIGGTIYQDETLWYVGPDMSSIAPEDDTWSIHYDIVPNIKLTINKSETLELTNEIQFTFDTILAGILESYFPNNELPIAYFIERIVGVMAGWNSFYLSKTQQLPHIDWENSGWTTGTQIDSEDETVALTSFGTEPIYDFKISDKTYDEDEIFVYAIGYNPDPNASLLGKLIFDPSQFHYGKVGFQDGILKVKYDFVDEASSRYNVGIGFDDLYELGAINYDAVIPVVITKDWVSIGGIGDIIAGSSDLPDVIRLKEGPRSISTSLEPEIKMNDAYKKPISLEITNEQLFNEWQAQMAKQAFEPYAIDVSQVEGGMLNMRLNYDDTQGYGYKLRKDTDTGKMYVDVYLIPDNDEKFISIDDISTKFVVSVISNDSITPSNITSNETKAIFNSEYATWAKARDEDNIKVLPIDLDGKPVWEHWNGCADFLQKASDIKMSFGYNTGSERVYVVHDVPITSTITDAPMHTNWTFNTSSVGLIVPLTTDQSYVMEFSFVTVPGNELKILEFNNIRVNTLV